MKLQNAKPQSEKKSSDSDRSNSRGSRSSGSSSSGSYETASSDTGSDSEVFHGSRFSEKNSATSASASEEPGGPTYQSAHPLFSKLIPENFKETIESNTLR